MTPKHDNADTPKTRREGSLPQRVEQLGVGQSVAEATRLELFEADHETIQDLLVKMGGAMSSVAARLKADYPDRVFKVERGKFLTESNHLMVVAVLTRTE